MANATITDWRALAACRRDPEVWFGEGDLARLAVHVCRRHCPVLAECDQDANRRRPEWGVQAALQWTRHNGVNRPSSLQPSRTKCGQACDRFQGDDRG